MVARKDAYWDDMRFPASAVNPPGLGSDPDIEADTGTFLFDAGSTELVYFHAQLPHPYAEYTDIIPHVHWTKTTSAAGDVVWQYCYRVARIGAVIDAAYTCVTAQTTVAGTPDNDTADEHLITSFGEQDGSAFEISDMLIIRLARIGGNAADTYGADARLLEFDIHYQSDGIGSARQFQKRWRKGVTL